MGVGEILFTRSLPLHPVGGPNTIRSSCKESGPNMIKVFAPFARKEVKALDFRRIPGRSTGYVDNGPDFRYLKSRVSNPTQTRVLC